MGIKVGFGSFRISGSFRFFEIDIIFVYDLRIGGGYVRRVFSGRSG